MVRGNTTPATRRSVLKISLGENGRHSLWRGIEAYEEFNQTGNSWLLKDAIMFFHQGVELLMKEILVRHSEYLIFDDLGPDTVRKQKQAHSQGIGIFFLPNPPRTVTYLDAIGRAEAFVQPKELTESLTGQLQELNRLRNQVEHYAVEVKVEEVIQLLGNLREPLLTLFENHVGGVRAEEPAKVRAVWTEMEAEAEVIQLIQRFDGQTVPGSLFNASSPIVLPTFTTVFEPRRTMMLPWTHVDIFASSASAVWIIEVKTGKELVLQVLKRNVIERRLTKAIPWVIYFGEPDSTVREQAKAQGILLTGSQEWSHLKAVINGASSTTPSA